MKPQPTAIKMLRGNPGKRPLNVHEPVLPVLEDASEAQPEMLDGDEMALAEWHRLVPMLRAAKQVTEAERGSLIALCQQFSRYISANAAVAQDGMVVKAMSGYMMPNPYISIANKALGNCMKLWAELGLTPSSRSRVTTVGVAAPPSTGDAQRQRYFGSGGGSHA